MRHSVSTWGKGRGVARVQRIAAGRKATESPNNVSGRRAHPPVPEKIWDMKVNQKERALARLRTLIYDREHQRYADDIANKRKTMVSTGDRSAKIRTYNYPQGRITDHRINYTIYNLSAFVNGDIQDCIDHLIIAENAERMKEQEL